jgi:hypothetical protein
VGWGALGGSLLGLIPALTPFAPWLVAGGAAVGGGIGAWLGGANYKAPAEKAAKVAEKQADATKENTQALRDLKSSLVGGGSRARTAASLLEREYALVTSF